MTKFTAKFVQAATSEGRPVRDFYEKVRPGVRLVLRVRLSGVKTWEVVYSRKADRVRRRLALQDVTAMTLAEARNAALSVAAEVVDGGDPAADRGTRRKRATTPDGDEGETDEGPLTMRGLWRKFETLYAARKGLRPSTLQSYRQIWTARLCPALGDRLVTEVKRAELSAVLDQVGHVEGRVVLANRAGALLQSMFAYALAEGWVDTHPAVRLPKRGRETPRDRALTDAEIRVLWADLDSRHYRTRALYRLMLWTGCRGGEVKSMRWPELDLDAGIYRLPGTRAKNRKARRVVLVPEAVAELRRLWELRSDHERTRAEVFVAGRGGDGSLTWTAPTMAKIRRATGIEFKAHDVRRTVATGLARLGVADNTISRVLGHAPADAARITTRIYQVDDRLNEQRRALELWANHLREVVSGESATNHAEENLLTQSG